MPNPSPIIFDLAYQPPFDWESLLASFRAHCLPDLESVDESGYERVFPERRNLGWFRVTHNGSRKRSLRVKMQGSERSVGIVSASVRRMFDLDADPARIGHALGTDPCLATLWSRYPGLRIARSWNLFEAVVSTVLGQLVSVGFARTLIGELMRAAGERAKHPHTGEEIHLFPAPRRLLRHELLEVRTSALRRVAIRRAAELALEGAFEPLEGATKKLLRDIPGVGLWTAEYIALRGLGDNDAFPASDYVLKREMKLHPELDVGRVRPWRAYAALALWRNYAERPRT